MNFAPDDPESQLRIGAFLKTMAKLGWVDGRNIRIDIRWAANDDERYRRYSLELVALAPEVIVASASPSVAALQRATRSIPIVFANVIDPVGAGFVSNLARPGGNTTGFAAFEYSTSGKWLELLKQIAPQIRRVAVLRDPALAAGIGQFAAIQSLAPSFSVELSPIDVRDTAGIDQAVTAFAREPDGGLIVAGAAGAVAHREFIAALAVRCRLPAIYPFRFYATAGGLASYGPDPENAFEHAATYVDRILKGAKPGDLPVQAPTRFEFVLNLKAAKAIGLAIPQALLSTADEVLE
jgi:putative ABC transport system substrate-binding protein